MKKLTEELHKQFNKILKEQLPILRDLPATLSTTNSLLLKAVEDYFKQNGKKGGDSTKQKHPNHFKEAGKRGAMKRWKK